MRIQATGVEGENYLQCLLLLMTGMEKTTHVTILAHKQPHPQPQ